MNAGLIVFLALVFFTLAFITIDIYQNYQKSPVPVPSGEDLLDEQIVVEEHFFTQSIEDSNLAEMDLYIANSNPRLITDEEYALRLYLLILHHDLDESEYPNIVELANK